MKGDVYFSQHFYNHYLLGTSLSDPNYCYSTQIVGVQISSGQTKFTKRCSLINLKLHHLVPKRVNYALIINY